jgi:transcriptional regulator with XRE-family HTH domain/Zn-dependent peptidase ImmA (M78 family)
MPRAAVPLASAERMCDYRTMSGDVEWADVGERMREARLAAGLTQEELGAAAGLDRTMIVKIESGNRRIDAMELVRLSSALQVPVDFLLRPTPPVLSRRTGVVTEEADTEVAREAGRLDLALVAWLHEVEQLVELGVLQLRPPLRAETPVDSHTAARELALWVRKQLGMGLEAIDSLAEICERAGQYVLVADVRGEGASVIEGDVAVAVVSLRGDPGRRRATAAHELGHLVVGDEYSSDLGVHASRADRETLLDAFAAELLLPSQVLTLERGTAEAISRDQLIGLAARYRISWSLALRQAAHAEVLSAQARRDWGRSAPTRSEFMEAVGWAPQPDLEAVRVPPRYAHAVMEAWRRGLLTAARAVELMHGQITAADLPAGVEAYLAP